MDRLSFSLREETWRGASRWLSASLKQLEAPGRRLPDVALRYAKSGRKVDFTLDQIEVSCLRVPSCDDRELGAMATVEAWRLKIDAMLAHP